jgi:GTP-binding protein
LLKKLTVLNPNHIESLVVDVPQEVRFQSNRSGNQEERRNACNGNQGDLQHLEFEIPSRGIDRAAYTRMLTATTGEAVMAHRFEAYEPWKGQIPGRNNGVLVSMDKGMTTALFY